MKFGKRLQSQIEETMPEWRPHFISYKKLKRSLKNMQAPLCFSEVAFVHVESASVELNATSVVDAVDKELRRACEAGGRTSVQEAVLSKLSGDVVRFVGNGSAGGLKSDGSLLPALSSVEQDLARPGDSREETNEDTRRPKRARLEDGNSSSEADFVSLLNKELNKLNVFFIEKEEEYVIRLQELKYRIERVKKEQASYSGRGSESGGNEELLKILRDIVTFHGEMVLLENYSSLNYTASVYRPCKDFEEARQSDGHGTQATVYTERIAPAFFTTELLSKLVRECENNLHSLFPVSPLESVCSHLEQETSAQAFSASNNDGQGLPFTSGEAVEMIYRSTVVALRTMKEIRQSSTRSIFSLPPMSRIDCDDRFGVVIDERKITPVAVAL